MKSDFISAALNGRRLTHFVFVALLLAAWLLMSVIGAMHYPGSSQLYLLFSIAALVMLTSGVYKQVGYGYFFLVVFLWLGFWFKLTMHQIFAYPFGEPVGLFDYSATSWDRVLVIAIFGFIGVLVARTIYGLLGCNSTLMKSNIATTPAWYLQVKNGLWIGFFFILIGLAAINIIYGVQQSGLVPRTILIWPLNAVIYWALSSGLAMLIVTMLWWEIASKNNISLMAYAIIVETFFSTVSLLSRGLFVFHAIPAMFSLYTNREYITKFSLKKIIIYIFVFIFTMITALSLVNTLRGYYYSNVPPVFINFSYFNDSSNNRSVNLRHLSFVVDRWVGLEGVMAVSAYPGKSTELFHQAIVEKSIIGRSTRYQDICLAHYRFMDMNKFQFASLPGSIAFLFYTGSVLVVMLGMMVFTLLLLFSEKLVSYLTNNPLLSSFWGCAVANTIAQFGVAPRGLVPYFSMNILAIIMIWVAQSTLLTKILFKIGVMKA